MQQTTLMRIKSNLETLRAVNNGTVPVSWPLANPNPKTGFGAFQTRIWKRRPGCKPYYSSLSCKSGGL